MEFTPESIAISAGTYAGIGFITFLKYAAKKRKTKLRALVLGSGSGKSTLCKSWNELYSEQPYYFLDLEAIMMKDAKIPKVVLKELENLKKNDCILYTARVMKFYRAIMTDILPVLKKLDKTIVVVVSNRNIAKFLQIKRRHYLTSDRKLYKIQYDASANKDYLSYCRHSMKANKTELYRDYDELLTKVQQLFGIVDKL